MAARKPGIAKRGPRSSKVVPINAGDVDNIKWAAHIALCNRFMADAQAIQSSLGAADRNAHPEPHYSLRQRFANWLESRIIPRLRRA